MVRAAEELSSLRDQTGAFIASDPTPISIERTPRVDDGGGGWYWGDPVTLDPQIVKMQPVGDAESYAPSESVGSVRTGTHHVFGTHDLNVQAGDEFDWNGHRWKVDLIDDTLDYRTIAEVVRL